MRIQKDKDSLRKKIYALIDKGDRIGKEEFNPASNGFPLSYVKGPMYDEWMADINIFNTRNLQGHPLHEEIDKIYKKRDNDPNAHHNMMVQLKAIADDNEFWDNEFESSDSTEEVARSESRKVFIVHGHDDGAKQTMARFLEQLDLRPIILSEQPDSGKTIIEKIEEESADVVYAIVLYTPCDIGREKEEEEENPRARQNVVFEHGYLIGKLGRNKVCAVVVEGVETPSDISGVIYKKMDAAGEWKLEVAKELQNAGIDIDMNNLL